MSETIQQDLVNAHGDSLVAGDESEYQQRYTTLFNDDLITLQPLFELGALLYGFFSATAVMRPEFRADLKADLIAEMHQQRANQRTRAWRFAASVAVAGVIAAASWRAVQTRYR